MGSPKGAEIARTKLKEKLGEEAHKIVGAKGGSVKSDAKKEAARLREARKREAKNG